jgi:hypothetical protein
MLYLITKALISGVIITPASEAAKRSPTYGALLVSLPLVSKNSEGGANRGEQHHGGG